MNTSVWIGDLKRFNPRKLDIYGGTIYVYFKLHWKSGNGPSLGCAVKTEAKGKKCRHWPKKVVVKKELAEQPHHRGGLGIPNLTLKISGIVSNWPGSLDSFRPTMPAPGNGLQCQNFPLLYVFQCLPQQSF